MAQQSVRCDRCNATGTVLNSGRVYVEETISAKMTKQDLSVSLGKATGGPYVNRETGAPMEPLDLVVRYGPVAEGGADGIPVEVIDRLIGLLTEHRQRIPQWVCGHAWRDD